MVVRPSPPISAPIYSVLWRRPPSPPPHLSWLDRFRSGVARKPARTARRTVVVRAFDQNDDDSEDSCELPSIQLQTKSKPDSFINLAVQHFSDEFGGIGEDLMITFKDLTGQNKGVSRMPTCLGLVLDDEKVGHKRLPPSAPRAHQPYVLSQTASVVFHLLSASQLFAVWRAGQRCHADLALIMLTVH
jgi:hypothetical protein